MTFKACANGESYVVLVGEPSGTFGVAHSVHRCGLLGYQVLAGGMPLGEALALLSRLANKWECPMYGHTR